MIACYKGTDRKSASVPRYTGVDSSCTELHQLDRGHMTVNARGVLMHAWRWGYLLESTSVLAGPLLCAVVCMEAKR